MPLTQEGAQLEFGEALELADVWEKTEPVCARFVQEAETITANDGQVQRQQRCQAGEWVVLNQDQELYTMSNEQFTNRYTKSKRVAPKNLRAEGFRLFEPIGSVEAYTLQEADLAKFPNRSLKPKNGDAIVVSAGGVLARSIKAGHDEIYFIPKEIFARTYVRADQRHVIKMERWRKRAYLVEPEHSRVLPNVAGFATHAKVLLPEADNVSEACVRPAVGEEPGYLVVTTKSGLRLLVFELRTFALKLDVPLADINRTSPTPFCSFHHRDASLLHVTYMVVQWEDVIESFDPEESVPVSDTTESRFAVFTPNHIVSKGNDGKLVFKTLWEEEAASDLSVQPDGDIDPRMVASVEEDVVFVVATAANNERTLNAINITDLTVKTTALRPNGLLLPFAIHPEWLFVVSPAGVQVREQKTLAPLFDFELACDPRTFRVLLSPARTASEFLPTIVANSEQAHHLYMEGGRHWTLELGRLPLGWKIVAVYDGGMVVADTRGHMMSLLKSSHPLIPLGVEHERRSSLLACPDPKSSRLAIVDNQTKRLWFFQQCQVREKGPHSSWKIGVEPIASAICVDWCQEEGVESRIFVADAERVHVFSQATKARISCIEVRLVDSLCVVHERQALYLHRKGESEVLRFDLGTLELREVIATNVGASSVLMSLGDGAVAVVGASESQVLGKGELVTHKAGLERLGSVQGRFVFASSIRKNTIEVRQGRHIESVHDIDGDVTFVAKGLVQNFVVFVTVIIVQTGDENHKRWCVCRLKIRDPPRQGKGKGNGEGEGGNNTKSVVRLASFDHKVTECFVLQDVVAVRCSNRVCVIGLHQKDNLLAAHKFLSSREPQALLDGSGSEDILRAMARAQEVFWLQMLRRKANLRAALTQNKFRLLPVIPMSDILGMVLKYRAKEEQKGLVPVVLEAYVEHVQRHNDRRLELGDAEAGWEVDFRTMDEGFLSVLLDLIDKFPEETARFLTDLPLVRLHQRAEDRVFRNGVPPEKEEQAQRFLVIGSSNQLDGMEWGKEGVQPKTVGDYVVPFPSHSSGGDDLLAHVARDNCARFVHGIVLKTVITHRWRSFARGLHFLRLLQYLCILALVIAMTFLDPLSDKWWAPVVEFAAVGALIFVSSVQRLVEWRYAGWTFGQFLWSPFDVLGLFRILLAFASVGVYYPAAREERGGDWEAAFRFLVSALVYVQWFGVLNFLQPFRAFGSCISMVTQIVWSVKHFLAVLLVTVLAASNALYSVLLPTEKSFHFSNLGTSIFSAFRIIVLADVVPADGAGIADESREWLVRIVVTVSSVLVTVVLLNLMIAAMADGFEVIQGRAEVQLLVLRAEAILQQQAHHERLMRWMRFAFSVRKRRGSRVTGRTTRAGSSNTTASSSNNNRRRSSSPSSCLGKLARCVVWPFRQLVRGGLWLVYAVPMERFLRFTNTRPSVLYDTWLHVLVPHEDKGMEKVSAPEQWLGVLHDLRTRLDGLDESNEELGSKLDKAHQDFESRVDAELGSKLDKANQEIAELKSQLGDVLRLLQERRD